MKACKVPCNDCPFRKNSIPGWLADYTPMELHQIIMNELPFPCHMAMDEQPDWEDVGDESNPVCRGSLLYMKKAGKMPRHPGLAELVRESDYSQCENILSVPEFLDHHKLAEKNGTRREEA